MSNYEVFLNVNESLIVECASNYGTDEEGHLHFLDEEGEVFATFAAYSWVAVGLTGDDE
jgi:hypothetical protein